MAKCSAPGCTNSYRKGYVMIRFPKDDSLREKWRLAVGGQITPTHNNRLCEAHFEDDAWDRKPTLHSGSIPTLFCTCQENTLSQDSTPFASSDHSYAGMQSVSQVRLQRTPLSNMNNTVPDHVYSSKPEFTHQPECPLSKRKPSSTPRGQPLPMSDRSVFLQPASKKRTNHIKSPGSTPHTSPSKKKSKKEKMLTKENRKLQAELDELKRQNEASVKMVCSLRKHIEEEEQFWNSRFGSDQIACAVTGNSKGRKWGTDSVMKGLQMRFTGGTSGLKAASETSMPLPGVRTLQRRTSNILFAPGVLLEILDSFKEVIAEYEEDDRDCVLIWDEMSIKCKTGLWDPGTKAYLGASTLPGVKDPASKALVFLFAGIRKRWKVTAAYHFVPGKGCAEEIKTVILQLLQVAKDLSLNIVGFVCDMGNRGILNGLGFSTKKDYMKNWIVHPLDPTKILYVFPDPIHVFKSHKEVFQSNEDIELPQEVVQRFNLPTNTVKFSHIRMLADYQENMEEKKFAPKLDKRDLQSGHFSKMKVGNATRVINDKTAEALNFLVYNEEMPLQCATTAWYVNLKNRWYQLVTSRSRGLALSRGNPQEYEKAVETLQLVIEVMNGMNFGGSWKVVQTHIIITTASLLAIQEELLAKEGYKYLCLGRFLQDAIENLFSVVRYRCPVPTAVEFKYRLKQIVLGQLVLDIQTSSYGKDDREEAAGLRKLLNSKNKAVAQEDVFLPLWEEPSAPEENSSSENVLYRMCGYVVHSLQEKKMLKCPTCLPAILHQGSSPHPFSTFTRMTNFSQGSQIEVSDAVFQLLRRVEFNMLRWKSFLPDIGDCMCDIVVDRACFHTSNVIISDCHPVTKMLVTKFVTMRVKQFSRNFTPGLGLQASSLSSKTMGSRYLAELFDPTKAQKATVPKEKSIVSKSSARRLTL